MKSNQSFTKYYARLKYELVFRQQNEKLKYEIYIIEDQIFKYLKL